MKKMKRFMKWFTVAALVAVIIPAAGLAQGRRNGINERQRNQQQRIRQGVRSGELTGVEAARIQRRESQIRLNEARARRSGGEFTPEERAAGRAPVPVNFNTGTYTATRDNVDVFLK